MSRQKDIGKMLRDFRKDFDLTLAEVAVIAKPSTLGFRERVRSMDKIRRELKRAVKSESMRKILFAYNRLLGESYFDAMVNDRFDAVLEGIAAFKQGVFD